MNVSTQVHWMYTQITEDISQSQQPLLSSKEELPLSSSIIKCSEESLCNINYHTCKVYCIFNLVPNSSLNLVRRELFSLLWNIKWLCRRCWLLKLLSEMWCPQTRNGPSPRDVCFLSPQTNCTRCKDITDQTWAQAVQNRNAPRDITVSWNSKNPRANTSLVAWSFPNDLEGNH